MRIIAGNLKGRKIKGVAGLTTRPTADKVKGAIFNVLGAKVTGAKVLDLFAGTGNLSLEAISRGAAEARLVEKNNAARQVIAANVENMGIKEQVEIIGRDAFLYLAENKTELFDLIFLDPPYHQGLVERAMQDLGNPCRLKGLGVIVAETGKDEEIVFCPPFELRKWAIYGDSKIWYFQCIDS